MANTAIIDLAKPAGTDHALISVINSNMDKIDAEAGRQRGNFAGTYSTTSGYAVGDYCIYQGNLYRCTTAIGSSGENWTAGHWTLVKVGSELKGLSDQIDTKADEVKLNLRRNYVACATNIEIENAVSTQIAVMGAPSQSSVIGINVTSTGLKLSGGYWNGLIFKGDSYYYSCLFYTYSGELRHYVYLNGTKSWYKYTPTSI